MLIRIITSKLVIRILDLGFKNYVNTRQLLIRKAERNLLFVTFTDKREGKY